MYYLIENQDQLDYLLNVPNKESCYINVITLNSYSHPILSNISLIYIKPFNDKGYMICLNHSEGFNIGINNIEKLLNGYKNVYALDSKYHLYFFPKLQTIDINFFIDKPIDQEIYNTKVHNHFYDNYKSLDNVNALIPISKHYEKQEKIYENVKYLIGKEVNRYNDILTNVFWNIEKNGMKINNKIHTYFKIDNPNYSIKNNIIYSRYNLYNYNTRPTNHFNNVNFSTLTNDAKESFIPKNDFFIEFDYMGFHPRLIAKIINYTFQETSVYEELAKLYFNTSTPNIDEIKESKKLTFKQIYGQVSKEYLNIEYFSKINNFVNEKWDEYNRIGYLELFGGKRIQILDKHYLLSNLIQSYETYHNAQKIGDIIELLKDKTTELVNYNYDSMCFDVSKSDGKELLIHINNILSSDFPTKITYGTNYKNMQSCQIS